MSPNLTLILDNIRSVHNVGSLFRTADAVGVERLVLCGYTPDPIDRFGRARKDFAKVSLGAEISVPWSHRDCAMDAIRDMKAKGFIVAALEQDPRSSSLFDWQPPHDKVALVLGNEIGGISPEVLDAADTILEIPMRGEKESLNVSVAGGIALYAIGRAEK